MSYYYNQEPHDTLTLLVYQNLFFLRWFSDNVWSIVIWPGAKLRCNHKQIWNKSHRKKEESICI